MVNRLKYSFTSLVSKSKMASLGCLLLLMTVIQVQGQEPLPGLSIVNSEDSKNKFISSPGFAVLPNGDYLATHLWYRVPFDKSSPDFGSTMVLTSNDKGQSWKSLDSVKGQVWASPFVANGQLYLFGTDARYGRLVIRRSTDGGRSWSELNSDESKPSSGYLTKNRGFHTSNVRPIIHDGRVWVAVDRFAKNQWSTFVFTASVDADLLDSESWIRSNAVSISKSSLGGPGNRIWQGRLVSHPKGLQVVYSVSRYGGELAALGTVTLTENAVSLNLRRFVSFPGGGQLFDVFFDDVSDQYWLVSTPESNPYARANRLTLSVSDDLEHWKTRYQIVRHFDGTWHGMTVPLMHRDGVDLLVVYLCAWGESPHYSKPDHLLLNRVAGFRSKTLHDSPPIQGDSRPFEPTDFGVFSLEGDGFRIGELKDGESAFINFGGFKWKDVPAKFAGWKFTRNIPGRAPLMKLATGDQAQQLLIAVPEDMQLFDLTGWTITDDVLTLEERKSQTRLRVFSRWVKANEVLKIPQGCWSGSLLLIPPAS